MKLGNLKPVKPPSLIRRWLSGVSAKLASKYIRDCHPSFMTYVEKNNFATASIWRDVQARKLKKIMKILNNEKYKKFFYKAISYKPGEKEVAIKPWYTQTLDKIMYLLSKAYVFVFERKVYIKIRNFEKVSGGYADLSKRIDEYIASTTFEQRLSRMQATGVISDRSFRDDFDILMRRIPNDIVEERHLTVGVNAPMVYGQASMERKLPLDVADLIQMAKK